MDSHLPAIPAASPSHIEPESSGTAGALDPLAPNGKIAFILPVNEAHLMIGQAERYGLHVEQLQRLIPRPAMVPNRFLLLLSRDKCHQVNGDSVVCAENGAYSEAYAGMVRGFYLKL